MAEAGADVACADIDEESAKATAAAVAGLGRIAEAAEIKGRALPRLCPSGCLCWTFVLTATGTTRDMDLKLAAVCDGATLIERTAQ
jgi:hypothetical protein